MRVGFARFMRAGMRVDTWVEEAREALAGFETGVPAGITVDVLFDQGAYTRERLDSLFSNLALAAGLVLLVVFISMGWRSALLVGTALPVSALMAITGMRLIGLPIHQMSVTGLIVALGLLIDNAIVVVDEVRQRLDDGAAPLEAVGASVRHLAVPLTSSTLTTVCAFLPSLLLRGGALLLEGAAWREAVREGAWVQDGHGVSP